MTAMSETVRSEIVTALRKAPEGRLRAVIAAIDRHPRCAEVEDLVELVRPRIAGLHIPRPLTPQRALVVPFEGLLAAGDSAPLDGLRMPRAVLPPLFALVRERIDPATWAEAERLAEGQRADDTPAVMAVGRRLWPCAVEALEAFRNDPRGIGRALAAAGHDAQLLADGLARIIPLMRLGEAMAAALLPRDGVALDPTLSTAPHRGLLVGCVRRDPGLFRLIAAAMLFQSEFPGSVTRIIRDIATKLNRPAVFGVVGEVADALKADLEAPLTGPGRAVEWRSQAAMRLVAIVSALEGIPRFTALAIEVGRMLGVQFTATVRDSVIAPLTALAREGNAEPDTLRALEAAAQAAKRIEAAGRRAGVTSALQNAKTAARQPLAALMRAAAQGSAGGIGRAEIARLAEILLGSDEAMALLTETG
jgi:hypothetical protein